MSYNPLLPNKFQVCKLDNPFQSAKETWVTAVVQQSSSTSAFDGMLRSLLTAARQPSVEDSLGGIQARLLHAGSRCDGPPSVHALFLATTGYAMMKGRWQRIANRA